MCLFSDIDECSEGIVMIGGSGGGAGSVDLWCEQHCNNTGGGYDCVCYSLDDNNQTCLGSLL